MTPEDTYVDVGPVFVLEETDTTLNVHIPHDDTRMILSKEVACVINDRTGQARLWMKAWVWSLSGKGRHGSSRARC